MGSQQRKIRRRMKSIPGQLPSVTEEICRALRQRAGYIMAEQKCSEAKALTLAYAEWKVAR